MSAFDELKAKYIDTGDLTDLEFVIVMGGSHGTKEKAAAELAAYRAKLERLEAVEAERDTLQAALQKIEYVYMLNHTGDTDYYCPECRTLKGYGHTKDCQLAAALAQPGEEG
jgi:hypothetical protein